MKRKLSKLITLFLTVVMSVLCLFACNESADPKAKTKSVDLEKVTETLIVMKVNEAEDGATALSALTKLKEEGKITFEVQESTYGAYITSINGKAEQASGNSGYSWMLYTSDEEYSSTEFGSVEYNGKTYGSSSLGASSLVVKSGEYYIWSYDAWSY